MKTHIKPILTVILIVLIIVLSVMYPDISKMIFGGILIGAVVIAFCGLIYSMIYAAWNGG